MVIPIRKVYGGGEIVSNWHFSPNRYVQHSVHCRGQTGRGGQAIFTAARDPELSLSRLTLLSTGGNPKEGIPAVSWRIKDGIDPGFTLYDLADRLAGRGWQVPAYSLEPICEDLVIQRILIRHGVSKDLGALLIEDFKRCIAYFNAHPITSPMTAEEASGFHH